MRLAAAAVVVSDKGLDWLTLRIRLLDGLAPFRSPFGLNDLLNRISYQLEGNPPPVFTTEHNDPVLKSRNIHHHTQGIMLKNAAAAGENGKAEQFDSWFLGILPGLPFYGKTI